MSVISESSLPISSFAVVILFVRLDILVSTSRFWPEIWDCFFKISDLRELTDSDSSSISFLFWRNELMSFFCSSICNVKVVCSFSNSVKIGVSSGILVSIWDNRFLLVIILLSAPSKVCFTPLNSESILDFAWL